MNEVHESDSPADGAPVTPRDEREAAGMIVDPSPESLLRAIAAAAPQPWFPSAFASAAGIARDSLDAPLAELRHIGLAQIADWVRGLGQGYSLTPAGEMCARDAAIFAKLRAGPPDLPPPELETLTGATKIIAKVRPQEEWPIPRAVQLDLRPPTITPALLIANLAWFFIGLIVAIRWNVPVSRYLQHGDANVLLRMGAIDGGTLLHGEWWRLLTCCFVHIGLIHLLANLFALVMTGSLAEVLWGRWRLALIYVLSGIAGSCMAMGLHPVLNGSVLILAGASGAIWGLMTSLLAWLMLNREHLPPALVSDWSRKLGLMFLLNIGVSFLPGVSWAGHLGGGLAGFVAAGLVNATRVGDRFRRTVAMVLLCVVPILSVGLLAVAMHITTTWGTLRAVVARNTAIAQRLEERKEAFPREIEPKLRELRPQVVEPLAFEITNFVIASRQTTDRPDRGAYIVKLERLETLADEAIAFLDEKETGNRRLDTRFREAAAFARAQKVYLMHLRQLLDIPGVPEIDQWQRLRFERDQVRRFARSYFGEVPAPAPPPPVPAPPVHKNRIS